MMGAFYILLSALLMLRIPTVFSTCGIKDRQVILPCASCENRCGQPSGDGVSVACSCDPQCMVYGDCCYDFMTQCPHEHFDGTYNFGPDGHRHYGSNCQYLRGSGWVLAVSKCPNGTSCTTDNDFNDVTSAIPVLDTQTGVNYINSECAVCNGVIAGKAWLVQVRCQGLRFKQGGLISSQSELALLISTGQCYIVFSTPILQSREKISLRRNCRAATTACDESCKGSDEERQCQRSIYQSYASEPFRAWGTVYKNPYCALCQNRSLNLTCDQYIPLPIPELPGPTTPPIIVPTYRPGQTGATGSPGPIPELKVFSFTVLLDFNSQAGVTVGAPCVPGYVRVKGESLCRPISCPRDLIKIDNECHPSTTNITILSMLNFTNERIANKVTYYLQENADAMLEALLFKVQMDIHNVYGDGKINVTLGNGSMIKMSIESKVEPEVLNVISTLEIKFHIEDNKLDDSNILKLGAEDLTMTLNSIFLQNVQQAGINLGDVEVSSNNTVMFSGTADELVGCSWVSYSTEEYVLENNRTLRILATNKTHLFGTYDKLGQIIFICLNDTSISTDFEHIAFPTAATGTLGLVTLVLTTLSIVCLFIRLILQPCVQSYRTFPGWLQFHLCLSLCLAFLSLLANGVATIFESPYPLCVAVSVWMYWMFLSAFAWMLSIAFNTWNAFRPSAAFTKASEHGSNSIYRYAIPAWLVPLLLSAVTLGLDYTNIESRFRPEFGVRICWINQPYALLIYFGIPIACCLLLSIVFYTMTVCSIKGGYSCKRGGPSNMHPNSISTQSRIRIYVGLFVVMGICWVVGFAAAFIKLQPPYDSVLWYIFIILNASQGIFIFIFFVFKKRTLKELRKSSKITDGSSAIPGTSNQSETDSTDHR